MKILANCPKTKKNSCKGCKSINRCRLRRMKYFWETRCVMICMTVMILTMCFQLTLVFLSKYDNWKQERRSEEIQREIEEYKTPEEITRRNVQILLQDVDVEPITIIEAQPTTVKAETIKEVKSEPATITVATISPYEAGENYYYWVSDEDKLNLEKVVYKEAGAESFEGKVAVAAVVLNRWVSKDPLFDTSSVTAVIVQRYQFAPISGVTQQDLDSIPDCAKAVELALKGWDPTRVAFKNGAKFFYQPDITYGVEFDRRQGVEAYRIGNHLFHNDFSF